MAVTRPRLQLIQQNLSTIKNNNLQQQKIEVDRINKANEEDRIRAKNLNQFR
jgi:hypothetical protein